MSTLFESAIGDIIDVIVAIGDTVKDGKGGIIANLVSKKFGKGNQFKGSITRQANNLVMTFPVLMSNTISPSTALTISKAIERKMVVMMQMLFASSALRSDGNEGNVQDVIQKYYTGIDFKSMTIDDVMRVMDTLDMTNFHEAEVQKVISDGMYYLNEANRAALNMPVAEINMFNEESLNSYTLHASGNVTRELLQEARKKSTAEKFFTQKVSDTIKADHDDLARSMYNLSYGTIEKRSTGTTDSEQYQQMLRNIEDTYKNYLTYLDMESRDSDRELERKIKLFNLKMSKAKNDRDKALQQATLDYHNAQIQDMENREERDKYIHMINKYQMLPQQMVNQRVDFMKKQLLDSDVKKANEMVPAMLIVDFYLAGSGDTIKGAGIVGIKTRIIPVESAEVVDRISSKSKAKAGLVNLIRATTGETKFMKDFILNIDRAKVDAVARSKRGSVNPMWRVLERRANKQSLRKALAQHNDASPITTLVITSEEVEYLKKTQAIDLNNVAIANDMLEAYNLMGLAIVDESAEVVKFLWDGEMNTFEPVSFLALEKEDREGGSTYKKVINLMAKSQY